MHWRTRFQLALAINLIAAQSVASGRVPTQALKATEFGAVATIYNNEVSELGERALFPICIEMPAAISTKKLLRYLRKRGFQISDEKVCEPALAADGQLRPKDYPHGLRIFIDKVQLGQSGELSMHVESSDLTVRPGEHLAKTLRRGAYRLKLNDAGTWRIESYTKEIDPRDDTRNRR